MKALNSFPSKLIVQNLGSFSPRIPVHVSDRNELCFNLYSRNYNKAPGFCLFKHFQNKGIHPIHVLPSENQVELGLEHVERQDQESKQTHESKFVRVAFQLQKDCDFGDQFLIVGDEPIIGLWNPSDALPMTWSDGHIWTVELDVPAGKSIQYKFILKGKDGDIIWQPGADRIIQTLETMNRLTVCEDWENAELQTIIEEDKLSQLNEEPQLLPELSTSDILDKPQEEPESNVSFVEDTQIHAEEKPLAEPDDLKESMSREKNERTAVEKSEESADGPRNDVIDDLGYNGNAAAPLKSQEETIVESSLFDLEEGPVLVPGLIPSNEEEAEEEAGRGEVEEKTIIVDSSVEAFETQEDLNIPEFSKEQESNDVAPQEINATINDESEQQLELENEEQFHLAPAMEDGSNFEPRNDINWGRETVKKFLTKLGIL